MALLHELDAEPAHLMGFSDGGEDALLMASLNPDIAITVVTWCAAGSLNDANGFMRELLRNVVDNPLPMMQPYSEQIIAAYGKDNARTMLQNAARAFDQIIEAGGDISRSKVSNITCPVLLIAGKEDFSIPAEVITDLAARIKTVEVITLDGAGHEQFHMTHPDWLTPIILEWLKRH
jgi:valacyclovir hydrolase